MWTSFPHSQQVMGPRKRENVKMKVVQDGIELKAKSLDKKM